MLYVEQAGWGRLPLFLAFAFAVCVALVMVFELLAVTNLTAIVDVSDFCAVRALSHGGVGRKVAR